MPLLIANLPIFFWLLVGHALGDGPLQPARMSRAKRRGGDLEFPWWLALSGHAIIHGAAVMLATGSFGFGIAETVCHIGIDYLKCSGRVGVKSDQALHVFCKMLWFVGTVYGVR